MILRPHVLALLTGAVAFASAAAGATGTASSNDTAAEDGPRIVPGAYIVEFDGEQSPEALYSDLRAASIDAETRLELSYELFNGVSFSVRSDEEPDTVAAKIAGNRRVKKVWPVREVRVPDDKIVSVGSGNVSDAIFDGAQNRKRQQAAYAPHVLAQIDRLHAAGYTGKGVRIGIVDSGVDYTHPALGGCFGPGCLVSYGYDFIGVNVGYPYQPDEDPVDHCFGHGTHVAGIIAAQPSSGVDIVGVAPDAEIGAYRVMDCLGGGTNDVMIAAFNRAYEDGSHIITASIGMDGGWPNDPWSLAAQRIAEAGVAVFVAAGNSGEQGIFSPSNPASGRGVGSVASVNTLEDPVLLLAGTFEVDGDEDKEEKESFGWVAGAPAFGNVTKPLYYLGQASTNGSEIDACSRLPCSVPNLSEYVVLVPNGPCNVYTQALNILAKGGENLLFYGPDDKPEYLGYLPEEVAGSALTTLTQGKAFIDLIQNGSNVTVTFTEPSRSAPYVITVPNTVSGGLASFWTSWGPNWDLSINPSFAAPGSKILSTFPVALGSYSVQEGTSMACPFAAAALAVVSEARGGSVDGRILQGVLTSTARQLPWVDLEAADPEGRLAPVPQIGGGLIQAWDAAHVKGLLSVRGISFNDSDHHLAETSFTLENTGDKDATYVLGHTPALTVYAYRSGSKALTPFPNTVTDDASATFEFETSSIDVPAGKSVKIKLKCSPPVGLDTERLPVYSGYITLNGTNGDNLVVPYQGVAASMIKHSRIFNTESIFGITLGRNGDRPAIPLSADTVFRIPRPVNVTDPWTLPPAPWPIAKAATHLATAMSRVDVVPLNGTAADLPKTKWLGYDSVGTSYGSVGELLPKGSVRSTFTGVLDGLTVVPEGRYRFVASALKVLGNPEKDSDWAVAEIVPFYIEYI